MDCCPTHEHPIWDPVSFRSVCVCVWALQVTCDLERSSEQSVRSTHWSTDDIPQDTKSQHALYLHTLGSHGDTIQPHIYTQRETFMRHRLFARCLLSFLLLLPSLFLSLSPYLLSFFPLSLHPPFLPSFEVQFWGET